VPKSLLVFDLDGTLVDSAPDLLAALDHVMRLHGHPHEVDEGLRAGIGHGARHLIEYALHRSQIALPAPDIDVMHGEFIDHYVVHMCDATRPYPGLIDVLDSFADAGWDFAICTNKLEGLSRTLVDGLGIASRFAALTGGDTFDTRKPHPAHLLGTIAAAGGVPRRAVMVGDTRTDLDTARAAKIPFVGVTFGYSPVPMADLGPDLLIDAYADLRLEAVERLLA
jgi:phosphoglycolate phosphatase